MDIWIIRFATQPTSFSPRPVVVVHRTDNGSEEEIEVLQIGGSGQTLRELVRSELDRGHPRLVVDLAGVEKLDSSGVGEIVSAFVTTRGTAGGLVTANLSSKVRRIFELTELDRVIPIYDSVEAAAGHFTD